MKKIALKLLFFAAFSTVLKAQQSDGLANKVETFSKNFPVEKAYLSFDKPYYNIGDTVWFKSVLLNGDLTRNTRTDRLHVELFNDSLTYIENRTIALNNGLGYGDFALKAPLREGTYIIRAYTNWQQNFGDSYFFQKSFYVGNVSEKTWLLDSYQKFSINGTKKTLDLKVRLTNIQNEAIGLKDLEIYLMNGKKRLMRAELQTTLDGVIETQLPLGDDDLNNNYSFLLIDKKDPTRKSVLPIMLQDVNQVDLQFMPEGGYLVNGIYGKVAFKALGADGLGKNINGKIINNKNETVSEFITQHNGMGSFYLLPQKDEQYTAVFQLGGKELKSALSVAKNEGTTLRIDPFSKKDSIYIYVKASQTKRTANYQLLAQSAQETVMSVVLNLSNGFSTLKLPKQDFPDGVIHFTLFSPDQQPLNERQVFINRTQKINLTVVPAKNDYALRDSIALEVTATKEDGSPLSGSFSIAVTDDGQVKQQSDESNIASYFLLQSDVKGNIEDAGWYFNNQEPSTLLALDHLLLTQGWTAYNWNEILKPNNLPKFKAEKDNIIEGRLTNIINKPVSNINITLLSLGKNIFTTDTISNEEGKFMFKNLPLIDSAAYTIKIKNAKGKSSTATIAVDEFAHAKYITSFNPVRPWYANPDSTLLNYYKTAQATKKPIDTAKLRITGNLLKEVEIKGKAREREFIQKTAWDSHFFKKITEEELKKTPRKTLMDLLKEKIPGFTIGNFYADACFGTASREGKPAASRPYTHGFTNFLIGQTLISHVIIDKTNTHLVADGMEDEYNQNIQGISRTAVEPNVFFTNNFIFNTLSAEDIKEIVVYKGCAYYFLDITTRSGKGPWIVTSTGVYVMRPMPLYVPKEFYNPKYAVSKNSGGPDLRSTIFWDANVVTDENGKAKLSFYAADRPGSYTIKIEGTDLFGRFGNQKSIIKIAKTTESK